MRLLNAVCRHNSFTMTFARGDRKTVVLTHLVCDTRSLSLSREAEAINEGLPKLAPQTSCQLVPTLRH